MVVKVDTKKEIDYSDMPKTVIVIPTFNEEKNIGRTIDLIRATGLPLKIVIVDDGSTDKTVREVLKRRLLGMYANDTAEVMLVQLDKNRGKGVAFFKGLRTALRLNPETVVFLDADMVEIPKKSLYFLAKNAAQYNGSRSARMVVGNQYEKAHPFMQLFLPTRSDIVGMYSFSLQACWKLIKEESRVLARRFDLEPFLRYYFGENITIRKDAEFKTLAPYRHIGGRDQEEQFLVFSEKVSGKLRRRTNYNNKKEEKLFRKLRERKIK
jgi:glycosyltransferase involved in cell wall biosynthesis